MPLHPFPLVSPSASRHTGARVETWVSEMGNRFQAGKGRTIADREQEEGRRENRFKMATSPQLRELTSNEKSRPRWKLVEQRGPRERILTKLFS